MSTLFTLYQNITLKLGRAVVINWWNQHSSLLHHGDCVAFILHHLIICQSPEVLMCHAQTA